MAASLVESLASDFDPSDFEDSYQAALEALIEAKVTSGRTVSVPSVAGEERAEGGEVVDLLSALQRSVERARDARSGKGGEQAGAVDKGSGRSPATAGMASDGAPAESAPAKKASRRRAS